MRRCYVPTEQLVGDILQIGGDEYHHIVHVLRLKSGDRLLLCDGRGQQAVSTITRVDRHQAEVLVQSREQVQPIGYSVTLFQGFPRSNRWEWIIQKTTELGITRIVPILCSRSVPRLKSGSVSKRLQRWQRIANEASKQCERAYFPVICPPLDWSKALEEVQGIGLLFWENERICSLRKALEEERGVEQVSLFVGPEGGFTPEEIAQAREAGVRMVTLGKNILRTETAAIVGTALTIYELEMISSTEG